MKAQWRLLDLPPMTAAENMALDEVLVEVRGSGHSRDTLRFLQFRPATVLVGFHQSLQEEVRLSYCREHGIDVNRRITGGGGLLFDENQLGWEIICAKSFFGVGIPNANLFRRLCEPTITALRGMGIDAAFRPRNDIEVAGRKISGTGGTDCESAFLFQGTLLVDFDIETMLKCLRVPVEKLKAKEIDSIKKRVTCLAWELGRVPETREVKRNLVEAFEQHMGITLRLGGLTAEEEDLLSKKLPHFQSQEWIDMVRPTYEKTEVVQGARKSPFGLVRVTMQLNIPRKTLKNMYITGDFLSFPSRARFDLEAALRGQPLDGDHLCGIITDFFKAGKIAIPDMGAEDICIPLRMALEKAAIARHGIPLEHCNRIFTTNGSFDEVLAAGPQALLLPYCAKLKDCDLRFTRACRACGECSVGDAWTLGRERKWRTVCITSFEHLMQELEKMKGQGVSAFIGCCCQPFYIKHVEDFDRLGLPGILIDIENTTCYDLDQSEAAHRGEFSSQTMLNMALLHDILRVAGQAELAGQAAGAGQPIMTEGAAGIAPGVTPGVTADAEKVGGTHAAL